MTRLKEEVVKHHKSLWTIAAAPLLVAAIAAPSAVGQPVGEPMDMHASTVHKPAAAQQQLRSEGATSGSRAPVAKPKQDLRTEGSADTSRAPKTPAGVPTRFFR